MENFERHWWAYRLVLSVFSVGMYVGSTRQGLNDGVCNPFDDDEGECQERSVKLLT